MLPDKSRQNSAFPTDFYLKINLLQIFKKSLYLPEIFTFNHKVRYACNVVGPKFHCSLKGKLHNVSIQTFSDFFSYPEETEDPR